MSSSSYAPAFGRRQFTQYPPNQQGMRNKLIIFGAATALYTAFLYSRSDGAKAFLGSESDGSPPASSSSGGGGGGGMMNALKGAGGQRALRVATWNVAAINNNPFEYWITMDDNPNYEKLMVDVESYLETPGDKDVPVKEVFTEDMFTQLDDKMTSVAGWDSVRSYWESDFRDRRVVSGFMKDPLLGSKRLASMPDRITNTINVEGGDGEPVCRPTVINMYDGDLATLDLWWNKWSQFMFDKSLTISTKEGVETKKPYQMLQPIKKAKYPAITEQEEKDSLPLQTMCSAIFDSILVNMMNTVSEPNTWQPLKRTMVESLNKKKVPNTLDILYNTYGDSDIVTLQEVSGAFIEKASSGNLGKKFHVVSSANLDSVRDQNSVIFLSRSTFPKGMEREISSEVEAAFPEGVDVPVAKGDILAITTTDSDGVPYVVASFHGDTNGLATIPVLTALRKATSGGAFADHRLIFGLDANTYEKGVPGKTQDVLEFADVYVRDGLTSCWGDRPNPHNYTTFNARTYLQPQLNKACKSTEKREKGDVNPKDFILFKKGDFEVVSTWKDNTGEKKYTEDMAFPTLQFPSDHGVLATVLLPKKGAEEST